jgi:nucleoside-diphosphate-sugar epimerase
MSTARVLITGGNGFIGSHLAHSLAKSNYEVSLLDLKFTQNTKELLCDKIQGDVCDYDTVCKAVKGKEVVVHLAAVSRVEWGEKNPEKCLRTNTLGILTLLKAIAKTEHAAVIIFGSSREVYGEPATSPTKEDDPKNPISIYGVSKLASENLLSMYHHTQGLNYVVLRFSNVYGSTRDLPERVIPRFTRFSLENKAITVYGGQQVLDFVFIDDTVSGIKNAINKVVNRDSNVLNNDFNFTTGKGTSILDLAELVRRICASTSRIVIGEARSFEVKKFIGDWKKAKQFLDYTPQYSLENGLETYRQRIMEEDIR